MAVRLVYNVDHPNPIPVPPPPQCVPEDVAALPVPTRAVSGIPDLMHHKFAVRDGAGVLTGSTNWSDDSWTRQENVMVTIASAELAEAYTLAFDELWDGRPVVEAGRVEPRPVDVGGRQVRPWFCPGYGDALAPRGEGDRTSEAARPHLLARDFVRPHSRHARAGGRRGSRRRSRLRGCNTARVRPPAVVGDGGVGLEDPARRGDPRAAPFSGKNSTPWAPGSLHDFMHAKVTVADDVVFCGSFNLSRSGEHNAEDMLEIHDAALADELAAFVDGVRGRYGRFRLPAGGVPSAPSGHDPGSDPGRVRGAARWEVPAKRANSASNRSGTEVARISDGGHGLNGRGLAE